MTLLESFTHFFFQAEDGIRDGRVTGVQTCALPISAGEDGDDRERDREVREAGPRPVQLLLVAEFGESLFVGVELQGVSHFYFPLGITVSAELRRSELRSQGRGTRRSLVRIS